MVVHDFCSKRGDFLCRGRAVGRNFEGKFVEVDALFDTSAFNCIVDSHDRSVDRIDRNVTDGLMMVFVLGSGNVTSSAIDEDGHID